MGFGVDLMADIIHADDLNKRALQDKEGNWRRCLLCGGSAITGGSWLYAKYAVKKADRLWRTTEVWDSHGRFTKGTPISSGKVYTVKEREDEVHIVCALLELRHPTRRK